MATIEPYETSGGKRYQVRYRTPERTQTKKRGFRTKREVMRGRVYLNHRQVDRLAREAGDSFGVVLVLAYTGIRWGEMIALRVRDVDTARRRLAIERNAVEVGTEIHVGSPKNHERRSVPNIQMLDPARREGPRGQGARRAPLPPA